MDGLIIGAGPTGLTLGCQMLLRGCSVRLIDQLCQPASISKAIAIQPRTLELFEKMGLASRFLEEGHRVHRAQFYKESHPLHTLSLEHLPTHFPFILILSQARTEQILTELFLSYGGKIERGVKLNNISGSLATVSHPSGSQETIHARWFFGCDGAHSTLRHCLQLPFRGAPLAEHFALADLKLETTLAQESSHLFFSKRFTAGLLPFKEPGAFRFILMLPPFPVAPTLDTPFFHSFLNKISSARIKELGWSSLFSIHRRSVPVMRQDNCFLLGDAAHIHSPLGGQGLNTSVQDAYNLAWKLELTKRPTLSLSQQEALLNSFAKERLPIAQAVVRMTTIGTRVFGSSLFKTFLLPLWIRLLKIPRFARRITMALSELNISYTSSPLNGTSESGWAGPRPGERAPDAILADGSRLFTHLCHPSHTLLCFHHTPSLPLSSIALCVSIQSDDAAPIAAYAAQNPCTYLIRPDGIIAYRQQGTDLAGLRAYLHHHFSYPS